MKKADRKYNVFERHSQKWVSFYMEGEMMAIQDLKFKESDFVGKDVSSLPDQIEGQAEFVKARIDNVPKNMIALGKFNDLIDEMGANNNGVNAEKLNGQLPEYYATKAEVDSKASASNPTFSGQITANTGIRLPDGEKVSWGTGWGVYANDASSFYIATPTGHNKYLFFGVSENAWALLPNSTTQLGTGNFRWGQIYSTNATISTSDLKDKKDIVLMTEEQARPFIMALKPCLYKLIDGTSGRTHYGLIAQEVEEAMRECGISDMEFAGFIKSPKIKREQVGTAKDGAPVYRDTVIEGEYVYGLRYEEFIAPIISVAQSLMQENEVLKGRMDELEKRIEALEEK